MKHSLIKQCRSMYYRRSRIFRRAKKKCESALEKLRKTPSSEDSLLAFISAQEYLVSVDRDSLHLKVEKAASNRNSWNSSTRRQLYRQFRGRRNSLIPNLQAENGSILDQPEELTTEAKRYYENCYLNPPPFDLSDSNFFKLDYAAHSFPTNDILSSPFIRSES